ncbi:MAG: FAD-dependent oxidoreductase, partial [bacterium]
MIAYENTETGRIEKHEVDLVVLSSALVPSAGSKRLAEILGIATDKDGFFKQKDPCAAPLDSVKEGIYLAGCCLSPKDITDSIADASGAAVRAARHMLKHKIVRQQEKITPVDITGEPRIGVFVCHCGINIAGVIDVKAVAEYARTLKNVAYCDETLFACSASTQTEIQQIILDQKLNRLVVAACTPKTHEPIFQASVAKVGLNPYLFEMVNIRDQCSWVHQAEPEKATEKAKDLIRMAVAKARLLQPLEIRELNIDHDVLVIGGGVAGIQTAIDLAGKNFKVHLIERDRELGGRVAHLSTLYPSYKPGSQLINSKIKELNLLGVDILTETEIANVNGFVGNFDVYLKSINSNIDPQKPLRVGAIVVAVGSNLYRPERGEFGFGIYSNLFTNEQFEQLISRGKYLEVEGKKPRAVAFIQCVGSRGTKGNPGCSRYCCQAAIKQSIALRRMGINVIIFHRDIRVYSRGAEEMYREARGLGVLFIPYRKDNPPHFKGKKRISSVLVDHARLGEQVEFPVDAVILSL